MTRLTKIEKETIVLFNEGEDKANIYTHNAGLKKRLAAWAFALPVVCTPVGGIMDVAKDGENILLFDPGDINKFQIQLEALVKGAESHILIKDAVALEQMRKVDTVVR